MAYGHIKDIERIFFTLGGYKSLIEKSYAGYTVLPDIDSPPGKIIPHLTVKLSQVITPPIAKSQSCSKQNKDKQKYTSV
jgi:hypothetical protein